MTTGQDHGEPLPAGDPATAPPRPKEIAIAFPQEALDADAVRVIRRLTEAGHQAYLVGGCVRDLLFGLRPKDFDVVTSAHPPEVRRLFRNCRIIGRRFRLAHVYFRNKIVEVATFRANVTEPRDGDLLIRDDNRFGTADEDAVRRDFTINALFYDVDRQVIVDYVGGVEDAERRIIRCIGDPPIRFREDPIRMLRAVRHAARLGCTIERETLEAIATYRRHVLEAAPPRIGEELLRMYRGGAMAPAFDLLRETGLLEVVLPELAAHLEAAGEEEVRALRRLLRTIDAVTQQGQELPASLQLAALLSPVLMEAAGPSPRDAGARVSEALRPIAQRLSVSKRDCERIRQVLLALERFVPGKGRKRRSASVFMRRTYFPEALRLFELVAETTGDLVEEARRWRARYSELFPAGPPEDRRKPRRKRRGGRREHGEKGARTG
ncbi:MAG: polynucleotide adenylyltransferase PcnB [Acidobacteria bacterium]|nr:MAG: polynucleotide adenylyltransferase PcnB [Acidobacteriota bacterium]